MDKTQPLNAQEVSFLDRCVSKAYEKTGVLQTLNKADMPTLGTLRDIIAEADDVDEAIRKCHLIRSLHIRAYRENMQYASDRCRYHFTAVPNSVIR